MNILHSILGGRFHSYYPLSFPSFYHVSIIPLILLALHISFFPDFDLDKDTNPLEDPHFLYSLHYPILLVQIFLSCHNLYSISPCPLMILLILFISYHLPITISILVLMKIRTQNTKHIWKNLLKCSPPCITYHPLSTVPIAYNFHAHSLSLHKHVLIFYGWSFIL